MKSGKYNTEQCKKDLLASLEGALSRSAGTYRIFILSVTVLVAQKPPLGGQPFFINSNDETEQLIVDSVTISSFGDGSRAKCSLWQMYCTRVHSLKRALGL